MAIARATIHSRHSRYQQIAETEMGVSHSEFSFHKWLQKKGVRLSRQFFYTATILASASLTLFVLSLSITNFLSQNNFAFLLTAIITTITGAITILAFHSWRAPVRYDHTIHAWLSAHKPELEEQYKAGHFTPREITELILKESLPNTWHPMPLGATWHLALKPTTPPIPAPPNSRIYAYSVSPETTLFRVEIPLDKFWIGAWYVL